MIVTVSRSAEPNTAPEPPAPGISFLGCSTHDVVLMAVDNNNDGRKDVLFATNGDGITPGLLDQVWLFTNDGVDVVTGLPQMSRGNLFGSLSPLDSRWHWGASVAAGFDWDGDTHDDMVWASSSDTFNRVRILEGGTGQLRALKEDVPAEPEILDLGDLPARPRRCTGDGWCGV
ncbi:MAG: hypothetical protein R3C68_15590 [Myxococcota bacterium]